MSKIIHWWQDSSGRNTCHENIKGASFEDSFLGEIKEEYGVWRIKLVSKGISPLDYKDYWHGEFKSKFEAMKALEKEVDGRPLNDYD